jgi:hypothetical protein
MTKIILTTSTHTFPSFASLLVGLCKLLSHSVPTAPTTDDASADLSPRLRYDVGLSDFCPDRMGPNHSAQGSDRLNLEMMGRSC